MNEADIKLLNKDTIAFVDVEFHKKTLSSHFFRKLLKEFNVFDVWKVLEKSKKQKELIWQINNINPDYVICWQHFVKNHIGLKCKNLIWVPMYDNVTLNKKVVSKNLISNNMKILCFSKKLYKELYKYRSQSLHVKYYPVRSTKNDKFNTNKLHIFFWQRTNAITWNQVKIMIGSQKVEQIIIKKDVDNKNFNFVQPSAEDEKKYNISYIHGWIPEKEYLKVINSCNVFIAPRRKEGIGMAFLEAMAHGCCVVAPNFSTYNEYIKHGQNGILYNLYNVKQIDLSNIKPIMKKTYMSIKRGRGKWNKTKPKIIDFIKR